ncbi:MAG: DUF3515 family protein [Actinomycetes bacterium]
MVSALVVLGALTGCAASTVAIPHYTVATEQRAECESIVAALPGHMLDQGRRVVAPTGAHTEKVSAVWGDPTIVLRCGVGRTSAPPSTDGVTVNGIDWVIQKLTHGYEFSSTSLSVTIVVTVPESYAPEINVLSELAPTLAVAQTN